MFLVEQHWQRLRITLAGVYFFKQIHGLKLNLLIIGAWNRVLIEVGKVPPSISSSIVWGARVWISSRASPRVYTSRGTSLFHATGRVILDLCRGLTSPTSNVGNFDILNLMWFKGSGCFFDTTSFGTLVLGRIQIYLFFYST